jgi:type IV pilus assembly protein PilA
MESIVPRPITSKLTRLTDEDGFTLIELLVVIVIVGILAAIAIPTFVNQKSKANDAQAKALVRNAATTIETWSTDHDGSYAGVNTPADLQAITPSLNTSSTNGDAYLSTATGTSQGYTLVATSPTSGDSFSIVKAAGGGATYTCSGSGGGCTNGSW